MATSSDAIVTILDTSVADTGPTQTMNLGFLKRDIPARISILLASGDTVVVEGKAEPADTFETLHTFVGSSDPADIYLSIIWRIRRSVDGTIGDSKVKIENRFQEILQKHE